MPRYPVTMEVKEIREELPPACRVWDLGFNEAPSAFSAASIQRRCFGFNCHGSSAIIWYLGPDWGVPRLCAWFRSVGK